MRPLACAAHARPLCFKRRPLPVHRPRAVSALAHPHRSAPLIASYRLMPIRLLILAPWALWRPCGCLPFRRPARLLMHCLPLSRLFPPPSPSAVHYSRLCAAGRGAQAMLHANHAAAQQHTLMRSLVPASALACSPAVLVCLLCTPLASCPCTRLLSRVTVEGGTVQGSAIACICAWLGAACSAMQHGAARRRQAPPAEQLLVARFCVCNSPQSSVPHAPSLVHRRTAQPALLWAHRPLFSH